MMKALKTLVVIAACGLMLGCQTRMPTDSGKPEVRIEGATISQVKDGAMKYFMNQGFDLHKSDDYRISFEKEASIAESVAFGSTFNPTVMNRIVLTLMPVDTNTTRVIGSVFAISNPGSGFQRANELYGRARPRLQKTLDDFASQIPRNTPVK